MPSDMLQWLRRLLGPSPVPDRALAGRVEDLERGLTNLKRAELEREAATQDALDKLERFYKRLRQRSKLDVDHEADSNVDDITAFVQERRRREGKA